MFNTCIQWKKINLVKFNFVEIGGSTGKRGVQTSSACVAEDCKMISVRAIVFSLFFVDRCLMDIYSTFLYTSDIYFITTKITFIIMNLLIKHLFVGWCQE